MTPPDLLLRDFRPRQALVTKTTRIDRPCFPVIDAHNHLAEPFGGGWDQRPVAELLDVLDAADVRAFVDLDGGWSEALLHRHLDPLSRKISEQPISSLTRRHGSSRE